MNKKEVKKQLEDIFLKYKKALINNDTDYSNRIEKAMSLLNEREFKCLYMKYVQNTSMTIIGMNLGLCRSHTYKVLEKAEDNLSKLLSIN